MKFRIFATMTFLILCGCARKSESLNGLPPKFETASPESAVSSYFVYIKFLDKRVNALPEVEAGRLKLISKNGRQFLNEKIKVQEAARASNDIKMESVSMETETRGIVVYSYLPYEGASGRRKLKFIVIKEGNDWLIDSIRDECGICQGTGKGTDYVDGEIKKVSCSHCKGKGWDEYAAFRGGFYWF